MAADNIRRVPPFEARDAARPPADAPTMPGRSDRAAADIHAVSPEGRPADPKIGPGGLKAARWATPAIVVVAVSISAIWFGWPALVAAVVVGAIAMLFNPVMAATGQRAADREEVIVLREPDRQATR